MENRAVEFEEMLNKFYNHGLLKEVYSSDKTKICNAFDQFYVAFNLDMQAELTSQFAGFKMGSATLKRVVEDEGYVIDYFNALSPETQQKIVLPLDEQLFNFWMANKEAFSRKPPNPKLDLAYEHQLIAEQERKKELAAMMESSTNANTIVLENASQK